MVINFSSHHMYVKYQFKDKQDNLGKTWKLNVFIESYIWKGKSKWRKIQNYCANFKQ